MSFILEVIVTLKVIFGSRATSSSIIGILTLAVVWPGENLIACDTAVKSTPAEINLKLLVYISCSYKQYLTSSSSIYSCDIY